MIGFIGTSITITLLIAINYNSSQFDDCVRLVPFLPGPRASSLPLGSDARVGHFFSFRYPLVATPQLHTPYECWLLYDCFLQYESYIWLPNCSAPGLVWSPFITSGEPDRTYRLQGFHCCCSCMGCIGNVRNFRGNRVSASRCLAMDVYSDFTIPAFRHPSVVDSVISGTCLPSRCLAGVTYVTIITGKFIWCSEFEGWDFYGFVYGVLYTR
jgi:hypothetical protein